MHYTHSIYYLSYIYAVLLLCRSDVVKRQMLGDTSSSSTSDINGEISDTKSYNTIKSALSDGIRDFEDKLDTDDGMLILPTQQFADNTGSLLSTTSTDNTGSLLSSASTDNTGSLLSSTSTDISDNDDNWVCDNPFD